MTNNNTSQTALITGASRGLGLALARQLAHQGWNLIIDARGSAALETVRKELAPLTRVVAIPGDVTDAPPALFALNVSVVDTVESSAWSSQIRGMLRECLLAAPHGPTVPAHTPGPTPGDQPARGSPARPSRRD